MTTNTGGRLAGELQAELDQLKADRVYKTLNHLDSPQAARVQMEGRGEVLILSSNNYLGLSDEQVVIESGIDGLQRFGAGTGSEFSILPAQNANGNWVKVTQRVPVRIAFDGNPGKPLIAGLSTTVTVRLGD